MLTPTRYAAFGAVAEPPAVVAAGIASDLLLDFGSKSFFAREDAVGISSRRAIFLESELFWKRTSF
jgi:hypothetical protein